MFISILIAIVLAQAPAVLVMESTPLLPPSPVTFERIIVLLFSLKPEEGVRTNRALPVSHSPSACHLALLSLGPNIHEPSRYWQGSILSRSQFRRVSGLSRMECRLVPLEIPPLTYSYRKPIHRRAADYELLRVPVWQILQINHHRLLLWKPLATLPLLRSELDIAKLNLQAHPRLDLKNLVFYWGHQLLKFMFESTSRRCRGR